MQHTRSIPCRTLHFFLKSEQNNIICAVTLTQKKTRRALKAPFEQSLINVCAATQGSDEWMLAVHHVADMHKKNENVGELIFNPLADSQSVYLNSFKPNDPHHDTIQTPPKMQNVLRPYAWYVCKGTREVQERDLSPRLALADLHIEVLAVDHAAVFVCCCPYNAAHSVAPSPRDVGVKWILPILLTLFVFVHVVVIILHPTLHVFIHRAFIHKGKALEVRLHARR